MEAQMRSAGQCCSTRQVLPGHTVHQCAYSRRAFGGLSRCYKRQSGCLEVKLRSPPCSASAEDRADEQNTSTPPSVLPESCPQPGDGGQPAQYARAVGIAAVLCAALLALPDSASAAEALPLDFFAAFLAKVQALGSWGPFLFVLTVICCEMIPLFPTQPLALSSGLLFGPYEGAVCIIIAATLAASLAFSLSQGVGRRFAQRMLQSEVGEGGEAGNAVQRALGNVQASIDQGSFWQQFSAVLALRMTPVVPFSASSYLLGLTPLPFKPFFSGTLVAMALWGPLYASIGAASRALLTNGSDMGELLADLQARTGAYTEKAAIVGLVAGVVVLVLWSSGLLQRTEQQ